MVHLRVDLLLFQHALPDQKCGEAVQENAVLDDHLLDLLVVIVFVVAIDVVVVCHSAPPKLQRNRTMRRDETRHSDSHRARPRTELAAEVSRVRAPEALGRSIRTLVWRRLSSLHS